ncbi:hypothetical protein [Paenibacillus sp. 2003]|uniref:hypothetical protein n=1 Tax=Paenibacillus TaxID=44249 RepID=UPI00286604E9|nr:hypothetical protein [Paenibacillus sp. 2003]MDR6720552.1 hypothetical protein [Paenibacillus sp. 2003]
MPIYVLLVDDDIQYAKSLQSFSKNEGIEMYHVRSLDEMKTFLPKIHSGLTAIILDIKGLINLNDKFDDENFLASAITFLDKEYNTKPRIVLTGDVEGYKYVKRYRKNEKVYRKGNESEKEMFILIKEIHENLDEIQIIKKYEDVFDVFDKQLLPLSRKAELVELVKNMEKTDLITIKNSLGRIRDIQEEILSKINALNKTYLPDQYAFNQRGEISFTSSHRYLRNNSYRNGIEFPKYVSEIAISTYKVSCEYGVHTTNISVASSLKPSQYTVINALFALFDFIKWFKTIFT